MSVLYPRMIIPCRHNQGLFAAHLVCHMPFQGHSAEGRGTLHLLNSWNKNYFLEAIKRVGRYRNLAVTHPHPGFKRVGMGWRKTKPPMRHHNNLQHVRCLEKICHLKLRKISVEEVNLELLQQGQSYGRHLVSLGHHCRTCLYFYTVAS
jgi:hypothetical protein